jgi:MFS family permease
MEDNYRALLVHGQSWRLIAGLALAWLSLSGWVGLAIFLTIRRATNSYGFAGIVVASFSVGSGALALFRGRLLDRRGARPWLIVLAVGHAIALLALTLFAEMKAPPVGAPHLRLGGRSEHAASRSVASCSMALGGRGHAGAARLRAHLRCR